MKQKLLIVDDDEGIRTQMKWALNPEYDVVLAEDRAAAVSMMREHAPMVVLLDLGLPPDAGGTSEGFAALSEMVAGDRLTKVIVVTGQGERANAIRAIGAGAFDFLTKPVELEEVGIILKRAFHVATLERAYRDLQQQAVAAAFEGMLGTSPPMQGVFNSISKVASSDAPVLILGESGTGKEMAAQAIHRRSGRRDGSFVPINCGAIPESLLESELFGHEKGAFTGAHVQRKGRIETAAGGTLFLDEIGEIPLAVQVKLLRFLQEQTVERVGGRQEIRVDCRVIAATNADLRKGMEDGKFREDLYYRLAVVVLRLPPLREREGDVGLLAQAFLGRFAAEAGKKGIGFDAEAVRILRTHGWPGNVRELENRVRRAVIMAEGKRITVSDLELMEVDAMRRAPKLQEARQELEREMVEQALRRCSGRIAAAAAELGVSRPTLYELIEKLGIRRD